MIRVLHLITRMDMGGSAQNTLASCNGLAPSYDVLLGYGPTTESQMTENEKRAVEKSLETAVQAGIKIYIINHLIRRLSPFHDILALVEIVSLLKRFKPQILHTHSSKAGILGRLASVITRTPIVIHTPHGHVFYGHFGPAASKAFIFIEKMMNWFTDVTVALTQGELDDYLAYQVAPRTKLEKIHSGIAIERFSRAGGDQKEKRGELGVASGTPVIGMVGWLLPIKGPDILLEAMLTVWTRFPEVHLVFVGKGDMLCRLNKVAKAHHKEQLVHFLGWRDDIWKIMQMFDVLVLPSRNEGMGRVIVEAMAAGKPVVASKVGGIPDLVEDGVNGLLFPSEDVPALAIAIGSLIEDPGKAQRMGLIGKLKSREYSTEAMVEKLDRLYRRLIFNHQRCGSA